MMGDVLPFDLSAWSEATWAAAGTWATFLVYSALLVYAIKQVGEARKLREEQIRPFVVVDFDVDYLTHLRIANTGTILARNVTMKFNPPLSSTLSRPWPWENSPLFDDGIPTLAPGKEIRVHFDSYIARNEQKLDMAYEVWVTYDGYRGKRYQESYTLDLGIYENTTPPAKGLPELINEVEKIHKELHKWTDGIKGLQVHAVNNERRIRRRDRRVWIQRAEAVRKERGWLGYFRHLGERALQRRGWID